jgi:hypothetical protein
MPDRLVRSHDSGVKLQLDGLESFPQLRFGSRVCGAQRCKETVSGRE